MAKNLARELFFQKMDAQGLSLTFDDVRLKTDHSETMPDNVNLESRFSRNIPLKIPFVSAAMDTVTESPMAIEMAKLGGLGVIHKNLSPEQQAEQVSRVKHYLHGLIRAPVCLYETETVEAVIKRMEEKGYPFTSFPVINAAGNLVGIVTEDDFEFCDDNRASVGEIMSKNPITAEKGMNIAEAYKKMKETRKKLLPLIDKEGRVVGMYTLKDVKRITTRSQANYNVDKNGQLRVAAAIGVYDDAFARLEKLVPEGIDLVVIDTAHGDSKPVLETLRRIKDQYTSLDVVVGNISEPHSARKLVDAGADGIKVGQGGGSICTTRIIAGVGCPQVTAVYECARVCEEAGIPCNSDGGIRFSGDIPIAIGAGANSVMMGSLFAGTDESPGELVFFKGRQWKNYRGMGSIAALEEHKGSQERYGQDKTGKSELIAEGIESLVPYRGPLRKVIIQYVGGLKRGMGYVGAASIEELRQKADFRMLTAAGKEESHPHDVEIAKEAPNYSGRK